MIGAMNQRHWKRARLPIRRFKVFQSHGSHSAMSDRVGCLMRTERFFAAAELTFQLGGSKFAENEIERFFCQFRHTAPVHSDEAL